MDKPSTAQQTPSLIGLAAAEDWGLAADRISTPNDFRAEADAAGIASEDVEWWLDDRGFDSSGITVDDAQRSNGPRLQRRKARKAEKRIR